jgi:hypothetical protein
MKHKNVTQGVLAAFLRQLDTSFARPIKLYLIGETSQVFEGMRTWARQLELTAVVETTDRELLSSIIQDLGNELGVKVLEEDPGDMIPLPEGYEDRARPAGGKLGDPGLKNITISHFDPYSVSYRFIARGDETDYHTVLTYLQNGWVGFDEMNERLEALLPRFSMTTIQQDPAEFRRKYKGLVQIWRSANPHATHRVTAV